MRQFKLFISYSRADLTPRPGFKESRVGRIMADVKYDLDCHSARSAFKILRDVEILNISDNIRHKLQEAIAECDMGIALLSSNFCVSEECGTELVRLIEAGKPLFLIETEPAWFSDDQNPIAKHRNGVKDILNAAFWEVDENQKTVRFGYPLPDVDSINQQKYYETIQRVVAGVKARAAKLLRTHGEAEVDHNRSYTVFMACPTSDVKSLAMQLANTLQADGYSVFAFDSELYVRDDDVFNDVMSKPLDTCAVYVQLLGALPGRSVPATNLRLVRAQYEMAKKTGKPLYIWRASGFDIDECQSDYGAFLKEIALTCHLGNYLEFDSYLRKKLNDLGAQRRSEDRRAKRSQGSDTNSSCPLVAIDAAASDRDLAEKIGDALYNYVDVNNLDYDLTAQTLAEAVADSNALILAYGKSTEGQKRAQAHFNFVRRQKAEIKFKNIEVAVGNGAPPTAPPCPRGPNVHVITVADKVDSAAMFGFLKRLGISVPLGKETQ